MQYFNRSNSEVDFIKDKLRSEYIPTIRMFNTDVNIQPEPKNSSLNNIDNQNLISEENNYNYFDNENIIYNKTIQICKKDKNENIKPNYVTRYNFGKFYPNITTNYISNRNYYDSNLHEYLGRYLRAYRDFYGIDVMNFYNCFSNRFISSYTLPIPAYIIPDDKINANGNPPHIEDNDKINSGVASSKYDPQYKLIAFPILFDTEYKIKFCTSSVGEIEYQAVWFNGESSLGAVEVENKSTTPNDKGNILNPIYSNSEIIPKIYTQYIDSEFSITIGSKDVVECHKTNDIISIVRGEEVTKNALLKQSLLYLFIKFPSTMNSPIIVLEQPKFTYALNNELLELPATEREQVAFSDTLLEYLTGSVISYADTIHKNVHRIQNKILQNNFYKKYGVGGPEYIGAEPNYKFASGVFDEGMHQLIYKAFFDAGVAKVKVEVEEDGETKIILNPAENGEKGAFYPKGQDKIPNFMGFVDKNVEELIMRVPDDSSKEGGNK